MLLSRTGLWIAFGLNTALSVIYAIVGFLNFSYVLDVQQYIRDEFTKNAVKGLIATSFLSSLVVCVFVLASLFLMLGNFVGRGFGFVYGFVSSTAFNLSVLMLIAAMQMFYWHDYFQEQEKSNVWSEKKTSTFTATYVMAFILFIWYIFYFVYLLLSKTSLDTQNGGSNSMSPYNSDVQTSNSARGTMF